MTIQRIDPKLCRDAHETRQTFQQVGLSLTSLQNQIDAVVAAPGGAPIDATYITQTPNASLSAEQAMSALGTGLVKNTTATGVQSVVPDSSTVGQVLRVTGASTYGWGALDLADTDAVTGVLADAQMPNLTGDVTTVEGAVATTIANSAVTYAKIQDVTANKVLGRASGTGPVGELSCSAYSQTLLALTSSANWRTTLVLAVGVNVPPYLHAAQHKVLGADPILLDEFGAPTDNADLNASTSAHGLLRKLDNVSTNFLNGQGAWAVPPGTGYTPGGTDVAVADGGTGTGTLTDGGVLLGNGTAAVQSVSGSAGQILKSPGGTADPTFVDNVAAITGIFDGGGSAIATNAKVYIPVPFGCTITAYTILSDIAETVTIKTWKKATGTAIPTVADIISTSGVSLSAGTAIRSTTVTDFTTTTIAANDILAFVVTAVTAATKITFMLEVKKT